MKKHLYIYIIMLLTATTAWADNTPAAVATHTPALAAQATNTPAVQRNVIINRVGGNCLVSMQIDAASMKLKANRQMFITPYLESADGQHTVMFPSVVLSGRNMHYQYLRSGETKASNKTRYTIATEMLCNGNSPAYSYNESVPMQPWMLQDDVALRINVDTCGCGRDLGTDLGTPIPANLNPLNRMVIIPFPHPVAEVPPVQNHHGKARVQFQVDRFELHDQVYSYVHKITKRKHTIDNRQELKTICDSIEYATSDPNVEIAGIQICGFASPESPYDHNDYLATNRSRVLAEWIAHRYHLADSICSFSSVPENWKGFREQVVAATDITEQQRKDLLVLIDRKAYGSADWDKKEEELKTSPKFAQLYASKIHPDWFPELRYTDFNIQTRLKPMSNAQLHQIIRTTPELMSLNQIYTVASECEHGSEEFRYAMQQAIKYYPEDQMANTTAAAMAVEAKDYAKAEEYLKHAGDNDDANILRGIVATSKGDLDAARQWFAKAGKTPEAKRNLQLLGL